MYRVYEMLERSSGVLFGRKAGYASFETARKVASRVPAQVAPARRILATGQEALIDVIREGRSACL